MAINCNMEKPILHGQTIAVYDQTVEAWRNYFSMAILFMHGKTIASLPYYCCINIILLQHGQNIVA
jgi:hypothetical protein